MLKIRVEVRPTAYESMKEHASLLVCLSGGNCDIHSPKGAAVIDLRERAERRRGR